MAELEREHGELRLTWNGFRLNGGSVGGYIMAIRSKEQAERALPQLPVVEPAPAR